MLHITEFAWVGAVAKGPALAEQSVEIGKVSAKFRGRFLRVANRSGHDIALAFSHDPRKSAEATTNSLPLSAGSVEYFEVEPGTDLHSVAI